jgi:Lipid II flippase MurJ
MTAPISAAHVRDNVDESSARRTAPEAEPRAHHRHRLGDLGRLDLLKPHHGLGREQIIGRTLGASREADLYFASFTLPDFLNYLLAAGGLSIVFIPMFLEYFGRDDRDGAWQAFSAIANFLLLTGSVVHAADCHSLRSAQGDQALMVLVTCADT